MPKTMTSAFSLALMLLLGAPALAAGDSAPEPANFRVYFTIRAGDRSDSGNFAALENTEGNYVSSGDTPYEVKGPDDAVGIEYKKHETAVKCVVTGVPGKKDRVSADCEFHLSGPGKPMTSVKATPFASFQLQTSFTAKTGKSVELVDEKDKSIEVRIVRL